MKLNVIGRNIEKAINARMPKPKLEQLARQIGVKRASSVCDYIKGRSNPRPDKLPALANALGVSINDLLDPNFEPKKVNYDYRI